MQWFPSLFERCFKKQGKVCDFWDSGWIFHLPRRMSKDETTDLASLLGILSPLSLSLASDDNLVWLNGNEDFKDLLF